MLKKVLQLMEDPWQLLNRQELDLAESIAFALTHFRIYNKLSEAQLEHYNNLLQQAVNRLESLTENDIDSLISECQKLIDGIKELKDLVIRERDRYFQKLGKVEHKITLLLPPTIIAMSILGAFLPVIGIVFGSTLLATLLVYYLIKRHKLRKEFERTLEEARRFLRDYTRSVPTNDRDIYIKLLEIRDRAELVLIFLLDLKYVKLKKKQTN